MDIRELLIGDLEGILGVDGVALVEHPAIEHGWFAFNNQSVEKFIFEQIVLDVIRQDAPELYAEIQETKDRFSQELKSKDVSTSMTIENIGETQGDSFRSTEKEEGDYSTEFSFAEIGDQKMLVGPLMIPNKLIFRLDENDQPFFVYFSEDTIATIAEKMMKEKNLQNLNLEHDSNIPVDGYLTETWLVKDGQTDKSAIFGFNLPKGTWMGQYKIEDDKVWEMVKKGNIKGFSVEGLFTDREVK